MELPEGFRWANSGGSRIGGANGYHIVQGPLSGSLCGRYAPYTPPSPREGERICKTCERIAAVRIGG